MSPTRCTRPGTTSSTRTCAAGWSSWTPATTGSESTRTSSSTSTRPGPTRSTCRAATRPPRSSADLRAVAGRGRLGRVQEVLDHRGQPAGPLDQGDVGGAGEDGQPGAGQPDEVADHAAAAQAEHLHGVL